MTWTYTTGWLSSTGTTASMVKVRVTIGDTDSTQQQLSDEEIFYAVSATGNVVYAAAACCDMLAGKYARLVNTVNSELRISASQRYKQYVALADRLRRQGPGDIAGGEGSGVPLAYGYVGGAFISEKDALNANTDLVQPTFAVGQDDYPGNEQANRTGAADDFDI